ncbi:tetratricopeptide repeat protein [Paludibaculum fermentans]|uniref:tetratricopeptide repeat protein n=1 Tax=Paludibaculum fermentans TaxID=1473598 RepID=UPI003EB7BCD3
MNAKPNLILLLTLALPAVQVGAGSFESALRLADQWKASGQFQRAEREYDLLLQRRDLTASEHRLVLSRRAVLLIETERLDEAEALARRIYEADLRDHGTFSSETASALSLLGVAITRQQRLEEALNHLEQASRIARSLLGPRHLETARINVNLASGYALHGDLRQAERTLVECEEVMSAALGPHHWEVAVVSHDLGYLYLRQGRLDMAESEFLHALTAWRRLLGENSPNFVRTANLLIHVQFSNRRFAPAQLLLTRTLPLAAGLFGPDHPETARALLNQARLDSALGRPVQSAAAVRRAVWILARRVPEARDELLNSIALYRSLLRTSGDKPGVQRLDRWSRRIRRAGLQLNHSTFSSWPCAVEPGEAVRTDGGQFQQQPPGPLRQ